MPACSLLFLSDITIEFYYYSPSCIIFLDLTEGPANEHCAESRLQDFVHRPKAPPKWVFNKNRVTFGVTIELKKRPREIRWHEWWHECTNSESNFYERYVQHPISKQLQHLLGLRQTSPWHPAWLPLSQQSCTLHLWHSFKRKACNRRDALNKGSYHFRYFKYI